jgi:hypothetical protein
MKSLKILAVLILILGVICVATYFLFGISSGGDIAFKDYVDPYNFTIWRISDSNGNNPVLNYCLTENVNEETGSYIILQDWSETAQSLALEINVRLNHKRGMIEQFNMRDILNNDDITTKIQWTADFSTNRLALEYYVHNDTDDREIPRVEIKNIRHQPTWLYSIYLTDMVLALPRLDTDIDSFSTGLLHINNYSKIVFKKVDTRSDKVTYRFKPYGILSRFTGAAGEFSLLRAGDSAELASLAYNQRVGIWENLFITVLGHDNISPDAFETIRQSIIRKYEDKQ